MNQSSSATGPEIVVRLPRILTDVEGGTTEETVHATDVDALVRALLVARPRLRHHLLDEAGALRHHVRCALNGTILSDHTGVELADGDQVTILHSVSGG